MTLAVVALFAEGTTTLRNIGELARQGNRPHRGDGDRAPQGRGDSGRRGGLLRITPPAHVKHAAIDTYGRSPHGDVFLAGRLWPEGIRINDPRLFAKTFPNYFTLLHDVVQAGAGDCDRRGHRHPARALWHSWLPPGSVFAIWTAARCIVCWRWQLNVMRLC